jgi:thiamine biosynthesis lipoprotein ApbE
LLIFISSTAFAQGGIDQFQKNATIGGRIPVTVLIIGFTKDSNDIQKLFDLVLSRANEAYFKLDWRNSGSEISRLQTSAGQGPQKVSPEVLAAFQAARKISEWTDGAFDITYRGTGSFKDIKVDEGASTVEIKTPGLQLSFEGIIDGFLADMIIRYIYAAGMQNAMAKVGSIFRGVGQAMYGPWKIQVEDDSGVFAHHALNLTVQNTGVAAVSASEFRSESIIDPRTRQPMYPKCKGVVAVMKDAALAEGVARAVFVVGPEEGTSLLQKYAKGLIVDKNGRFIRTEGF